MARVLHGVAIVFFFFNLRLLEFYKLMLRSIPDHCLLGGIAAIAVLKIYAATQQILKTNQAEIYKSALRNSYSAATSK